MSDVSRPEFWDLRYLEGAPPRWDLGRVAPPIARLSAGGRIPIGRVLVPGAGRGHDALHLARLGHEVTAVDFAPAAVEYLRERAAREGVPLTVLQADLFDLPARLAGAFDAVLEHTCFCAIDPARRRDYVEAIHALLCDGGLLFGLFFAHGRPGGPPFTTGEEEVRALFSPRFELLHLARAPDSVPARAGEELEHLLRRR